MYSIGTTVYYKGVKCDVTRRMSMTLSTGKALHRYNLVSEYGSFVDVVEEDLRDECEQDAVEK